MTAGRAPASSGETDADGPPHVALNRASLADSLGALLLDRGDIDGAVLDRARRAARTTGERFDQVLTKLGLLSEADLTAALCAFLSIAAASPADLPAEPILPDTIKADFVRRNRIMPLALREDSLVVGVADPFNDEPLRALAYLVDLTVSVRLLAPADFDKAYEAVYAPSGKEA